MGRGRSLAPSRFMSLKVLAPRFGVDKSGMTKTQSLDRGDIVLDDLVEALLEGVEASLQIGEGQPDSSASITRTTAGAGIRRAR
mmetsp:Transcript_54982/g.141532  ORF Transcript_54982/g.141532 Transcript_54982/m.141532 type:complete len:84 (+) Transcript_54982:160-411(+)